MTSRSTHPVRPTWSEQFADAAWRAGCRAVDSEHLTRLAVTADASGLTVAGNTYAWTTLSEVLVVGAGKAGAGMVRGLESAFASCPDRSLRLYGQVNVPDDCVEPTRWITLCGVRPAAHNFPTERGVSAARQILKLVRNCHPNGLVIVLVSGGGSALLPAPISGISLDDKLQVTQSLSAAGASIRELNTVRIWLSQVKGGQLARACRGERLATLVLSDVIGDPLDMIASGPTFATTTTRAAAVEILDRYARQGAAFPRSAHTALAATPELPAFALPKQHVFQVVGNNATAVRAATDYVRGQGIEVEVLPPEPEGTPAEQVGQQLAEALVRRRAERGAPAVIVWGGEPVVRLCAAAQRGRGGRNQQLVLAACDWMRRHVLPSGDFTLLSGGTDGEDGPTDAAGAWISSRLLASAHALNLDAASFLARNDAYHYFERLEGLIKTGPTHTNVGDLRVAVTGPIASCD